jgi:hypothetical protein
VKGEFPKKGGTIREHQRSAISGYCATDADRSDSVLPFLKTAIELTVGATNYLNNLQVWPRGSTPPWLSISGGVPLLFLSACASLKSASAECLGAGLRRFR